MTEDITQLAQLLGNKLSAKGWQISCAESCTGGGVGYAITSISGSSAWFKKGFITYSNEAKHDMLGVSEHTLNQYGAVSAQTVEEMAQVLRNRPMLKWPLPLAALRVPMVEPQINQ